MRFGIIILMMVFSFCWADEESCYPWSLSIGPEVYTLKRVREGGTHQRGTLYGGRGILEYLAAKHVYLGVEGSYARGTLNGRSGNQDRLRSHFTDSMVEGRLGYTLQSCSGCYGWLTPFVGGGYFWEDNNYSKPSPKPLHFRNRFGYFALGCLARICLRSRFDLGLNVTARFSMQGKVHVSHDPEGEPVTLKYEQKINCRVVLPFTYICERSDLSLAPFFEYRHYGRRHAFPFDFLDTRLKIYGLELLYVYKF